MPHRSRWALAAIAAVAAAPAIATPADAQQVQIAELSPASVVTGSGDFTLTIVGSGFVPGVSRISFGGRNMSAASATPTQLTVRVPNQYITERVASDFRDDGIARVPVTVINGAGSITDHPNARKILHVTRAGAVAAVRPPTPVITAVGPDPVPVGGTLVVSGDYFDAPQLFAVVKHRSPDGSFRSYGRDDHLRRTRTEVRVDLAGLPEGSYVVMLEARDADGREYATLERPFVLGSPMRLGAPTVSSTGPSRLPMTGGVLTVNGANFADDVQVTLATPDGRTQPLTRAPNRAASGTQVTVLVPRLQHAGQHVLRVENPGAGTGVAEYALALASAAPGGGRGAELGGGYTPPAVRPDRRRPRSGIAPPAAPAGAHSLAIVSNSNLCLVPDADRDGAEIHLQPCSEGTGTVFQLANGYVSTAGGRCLDWGEVGGPLHLVPCKEGRPDRTSQQWYFHGNKLAQNALDPSVCMDVEREELGVGGRIVAYRCASYDNPAKHQMFYLGGEYSLLTVLRGARLAPADQRRLSVEVGREGGAAVFSNNARVISAGGGNVISAGGGNVISAGSGNVISAGGGNVISAGGGNVISAGSLNLRVVSDPTLLLRGASVISAGGLNVISAGGLNLIGGAGGNLTNLTPIPRP